MIHVKRVTPLSLQKIAWATSLVELDKLFWTAPVGNVHSFCSTESCDMYLVGAWLRLERLKLL